MSDVWLTLGLCRVDEMAQWSPWRPWAAAADEAPRVPAVYMARQGDSGSVVYVGMAGGRCTKGLRNRLRIDQRGKVVSELAEAAMDRALADPVWLAERLAEVEDRRPRRVNEWAAKAMDRAVLHVRWAVARDRVSALSLERRVLSELVSDDLWNPAR